MSEIAAGPPPFEQETFEDLARALTAGQAVVLPTDTVYGVAVLLSTRGAGQILSRLKARSAEQSLAVLVSSVEQAGALAGVFSPAARRLADAFWPGPLTLVLARRPELRGVELGGDGSTIGVRCPDHALIRELAGVLGPIVTTSANRHGEPTPATAREAARALTGPLGAVVDGGPLAGRPSTVVDCTTDADEPTVLREGALSRGEIHEVIAGDH